MGYYIITLVVCSVIHELGHAMAAVREDVRFFGMGAVVFFIAPVAFVHINDDQVKTLPLKNRLRILCAGVWHNIVVTASAMAILLFITLLFSPFYTTDNGVFVKKLLPVSYP